VLFVLALLDKVRVHIEHSHFALKDLAQVTVRDPQTLLVAVHDNDVSWYTGIKQGLVY
jgi:ribosome recycling factor